MVRVCDVTLPKVDAFTEPDCLVPDQRDTAFRNPRRSCLIEFGLLAESHFWVICLPSG
jgi:hypothetical protein